MSHPDVFEATVVPKPHPVDMNHLIGFVVRQDSKSNLSESDIIKFIEGIWTSVFIILHICIHISLKI